ncbi:MAG: hypothetical protein HY785_24415 [Oscillatoriophycideae cyanobacterium NC_groundwater_1537_Pr4_S-0.65um_50_18]|nr:hypothetical protein [Oscillatoriophycideae cyanobacterium NC_groundwater_1537_Pr4_S-0.65um_50_18]
MEPVLWFSFVYHSSDRLSLEQCRVGYPYSISQGAPTDTNSPILKLNIEA